MLREDRNPFVAKILKHKMLKEVMEQLKVIELILEELKEKKKGKWR